MSVETDVTVCCNLHPYCCTLHVPFPMTVLIHNKISDKITDKHSKDKQSNDMENSMAKAKKHARVSCCFKYAVNLIFQTTCGTKCMRSLCLPFPAYGVQCALRHATYLSHGSSEAQLFIINPNSAGDNVIDRMAYTARELNIYPKILMDIAKIVVVPVDLMPPIQKTLTAPKVSRKKTIGYAQTKRKGSDIIEDMGIMHQQKKHKMNHNSMNRDKMHQGQINQDTMLVLAYANKPLDAYAFQREYPTFTNICGYMLMKYIPSKVYTDSKYMLLHSTHTRLGRGDMVGIVMYVMSDVCDE